MNEKQKKTKAKKHTLMATNSPFFPSHKGKGDLFVHFRSIAASLRQRSKMITRFDVQSFNVTKSSASFLIFSLPHILVVMQQNWRERQ